MAEGEPTEIGRPRSNTRRNVLFASAALLIAVFCVVWALNYFGVNRPLQRVLTTDPRDKVVSAQAHFGNWIDTSTLVFDLTGVSGEATRMDVFRIFLQYAEAMKDRHFTRVILAARGRGKFTLDGSYFQSLGKEYGTENPIYTIRTFPIHLTAADSSKPFSEYEGGILSVLEKEMDQFTEFSNQWYVNDFQTKDLLPSIDSSTKRETTFDPCESIREENPHCGWQPHWDASGVSTNAIDGTRTEFLSIESTDPDGMDYGKLHYAELRICFENSRLCGGKSIGVGITVHGMVAPLGYESEYSTPVRMKFDDDKAIRQTWGISDDHDTLFPEGRERQFVDDLSQHNKLVLEFSYYEKAARTVTFEVAGLAEKMKSEGLVAREAAKSGP
jgi:hypothetical protein